MTILCWCVALCSPHSSIIPGRRSSVKINFPWRLWPTLISSGAKKSPHERTGKEGKDRREERTPFLRLLLPRLTRYPLKLATTLTLWFGSMLNRKEGRGYVVMAGGIDHELTRINSPRKILGGQTILDWIFQLSFWQFISRITKLVLCAVTREGSSAAKRAERVEDEEALN